MLTQLTAGGTPVQAGRLYNTGTVPVVQNLCHAMKGGSEGC